MVHNWSHKEFSTDSQILRPTGVSWHKTSLTGPLKSTPCKAANNPEQDEPTEKYCKERNRDGGNLEQNDYGFCFGTGNALQHAEGPSPVCTSLCAPVRVEDNAKLLAQQRRQISCSKLQLG